jgi:hypothetical protein
MGRITGIDRIILLILAGMAFFLMNSCLFAPDGDDNIASYVERPIVMNIDGTEQEVFSCRRGYPVAMNDNKRFIVCNEDLLIWDMETHKSTKYLTWIEVDYLKFLDGIETIGVSYDDNNIAFTSDNSLYCLDLVTNEYEQITSGYHDEFPKFGIDNRIYFSRRDSKNDNYKLMSIEEDGNDLQEICLSNEMITHIFPGQVDSSVVYFVSNRLYFNKVLIGTVTPTLLCELSHTMGFIGRSNDDQYFSFSPFQQHHFLFNTITNTMQNYLFPPITDRSNSKILPNQKVAVTKTLWGAAKLRLWDIDNDTQIGDEIIIDDTREGGVNIFCFTPNGEKVIFIHIIKYS